MRIPRWLGGLLAGEQTVTMMTEGRGSSNAKARRELGWEPLRLVAAGLQGRAGMTLMSTRGEEFEELRPLLFSIAYRILGSVRAWPAGGRQAGGTSVVLPCWADAGEQRVLKVTPELQIRCWPTMKPRAAGVGSLAALGAAARC